MIALKEQFYDKFKKSKKECIELLGFICWPSICLKLSNLHKLSININTPGSATKAQLVNYKVSKSNLLIIKPVV